VGEAILLGEILMGIDLEGDEQGDDSKCILIVYVVGLVVYIHNYGRCRPERVCSGLLWCGLFCENVSLASGR
jgi:hypothetical protein